MYFLLQDYPNIVRRRMDLGTIRNRLNQRFYTSAKECLEDLNTMFVNCYVFNMPGTVS